MENTEMFEDKTIVCKDCGNEFVWTAGEQQFFAERGLTNQPVRCKDCRSNRNSTEPSEDDKTIVCKDCENEFVWTAGEQKFFAERGLTNQPVRCKPCRNKKNARRNEEN